MPAQFTARNGRARRADASWISFASRSLPTPLSPVMSTFAFDWPARLASSSTVVMRALALTSARGASTFSWGMSDPV